MGDGETPSVAESRALLNAKWVALEQAGTYVESYTKVENFQLTKDEIQVLASGIMEVTILDKKRTVVGDGFRFWVKIKAKVNPDRIQEMAKKVKEKSVVDDYKKIQEAYDKDQKEIGELKKQLAQAKGEKEKKKVEAKITNEERLFEASQWFEKGLKQGYKNPYSYKEQIDAFTQAILLYPSYAEAYIHRGWTYYLYNHLDKAFLDKAFADFNQAILINPNFALAYRYRGAAYINKGQYDKALEDYNKAIAINPSDSSIYNSRGHLYGFFKGQYDMAIRDFDKALLLSPDGAYYYNRGLIYTYKGEYDRAIEDYNKAITIYPLADIYNSRGEAYLKFRS
jgi:tetratricopeptide (TPR) repeat protein